MAEFWRPGNGRAAREDLGGGRILIVDDDPQICVYVALVLKRLGFESSAMTNPLEALDKILASPGDFRALLTDERMPGLTGLGLIKRVWAKYPDFPVILMSGYGWGIDPRTLPGVGFLKKPFETDELHKALSHALAGHE